MVALYHITQADLITAFIEQQHIGMRIRLRFKAMFLGKDNIRKASCVNYLA